jgi:hypothetical protein
MVELTTVADNPDIRAFATVAGGYTDPETMLEWMTADALAARLARGVAAKEKFEATGDVDYDVVVDETRMDVAMPSKYVWDWYHPWADRGVWDNRYALMSDAEVLTFDGLQASKRIQTPWLMVHSDNCTFPTAARRHFEAAPADDKKLAWEGETPHLAFYSEPEAIDSAVANVDGWFRQHLHST